MGYTVGSVPYVNAVPLVAGFEELGDSTPVRVLYDVPSRLPQLLESGSAQAILVSSVDALRVPNRRMAEGVCIGSDGPVKSVRLFSKVPFPQIETLALDASSMTSNRLAQILLADLHGSKPSLTTLKPDLRSMLAEADACVLIGDPGMTADGAGLHVMDLGEAWKQLTGLPFMWAAWIGDENLTPELAGYLALPRHFYGGSEPTPEQRTRREAAVQKGMSHSGWTREMVEDYYENVMVYTLDDRMLAGYREYQRRLLAHGFDTPHFPQIVPAAPIPSPV